MNELLVKIMDKLKKEIKSNRNYLIFLIILMIIALVGGSIFSLIIKSSDKKIVAEYLNDFFNNLSLEKLNYLKILLNSISGNLITNIIIIILGFTIIGIPLIIFIFFSKIFSIGFTFASLIINFKIKGLFFAIFYLLPYGLLIIISNILIMIYTLSLSLKLFSCITKKKVISFKLIIKKYIYIIIITSIIILITSLIEAFFIPIIYKLITIL